MRKTNLESFGAGGVFALAPIYEGWVQIPELLPTVCMNIPTLLAIISVKQSSWNKGDSNQERALLTTESQTKPLSYQWPVEKCFEIHVWLRVSAMGVKLKCVFENFTRKFNIMLNVPSSLPTCIIAHGVTCRIKVIPTQYSTLVLSYVSTNTQTKSCEAEDIILTFLNGKTESACGRTAAGPGSWPQAQGVFSLPSCGNDVHC